MKLLIFYLGLLLSTTSFSQELTGHELLDKTLTYHDPNGNWSSFNSVLIVTMETPDKPNRVTEIKINLPEEYFYSKATRDNNTTEFILEKDNCKILYNGSADFSEEIAEEKRLSCDRATMYKNYYTYLYGLPMKLKDQGNIIGKKVERKTFHEKEYLVLKATYEEEVGKDIWHFYFDPTTYAMEVYQFFHSKEGSKEVDSSSGEYILLTDEVTINNIKMPKNRAWYTNKEDKLLGTDILMN